MDNNSSIVPTGHSNLPFDVKLISDFKRLYNDIETGQNDLKQKLERIQDASLKVNIERRWYGAMKKDSVEASLKEVYSNLRGYIGDCGNALKNTNENLKRSLDLIKLLALAEKSLYEQVDDQVVSNNELKSILIDIFRKQGIKDEDIMSLIENSIQKAYTLRDRINTQNGRIAACEGRINNFESRHENLDKELEILIAETKSQLQSVLNEDIKSLQNLYENGVKQLKETVFNLKSDLQKEKIELEQTLTAIRNNIVKAESLLNNITLIYNNKKDELIKLADNKLSSIEQLTLETESNLSSLAEKKREEIISHLTESKKSFISEIQKMNDEITLNINSSRTSFDKESEETFARIRTEKQATINILEETKDDFNKYVDLLKKEFQAEKKMLSLQFKKTFWYTIVSSVSISVILSYICMTFVL